MDLYISRRTGRTVLSREGVRNSENDDMPMFQGSKAVDAGGGTGS